MAADERQQKFFEFLKRKEVKDESFTKNDILKATGWNAAPFQ